MQNGSEHFEYRAQVAKKVERLADLLEAWDAWEIDQLLPPRERRLSQPPIGGREALSVLHHALLTELHDLDAAEASRPNVAA